MTTPGVVPPKPLVQQLIPSLQVPVSNTTKKALRRGKIEKNALTVLTEIPGLSKDNAYDWFQKVRVLQRGEDVYEDIREYIRNSQMHGYGIRPLNILKIRRFGDYGFSYYPEFKEKLRMMLWHGTKLVTLAPILKDGFKSPVAKNQMFGPGLYFADRATKSANYYDSTKPGTVGYLLLCEVVVGKWYVAKSAHTEYTTPPSVTLKTGEKVECDSVMSAGTYVPDRDEQKELPNGSIMPYGETIKNPKFKQCILRHNEFIVYNPEQAKIKYLVKFEFRDEPFTY